MTPSLVQHLKRILIADDDPAMRNLLTALVREKGYDPVVVDDGRQAFRLLQADSNFRAGIFDMAMPRLDSLDIIRYMNTEKRLRRIPVMMISAETDLKLMAKSFGAGATVFLGKPFKTEQFESTFHVLLSPKSIS